MMEFIRDCLVGLAQLMVIPFIASLLLWAANEMYYRSFGRYKRKAILITGAIGTPVHELAHAVTATLFGMRVVGMSFYKPDPQSGTLGYVSYRFTPYNYMHNLGIFFTGMAPLIAGAYLAYGLFYAAGIPNLNSYLTLVGHQEILDVSTLDALGNWVVDVAGAMLSWKGMLAIIVATMIGLHSTPSMADLRGSMHGAIAVFLLIATYWGFLRALPKTTDELAIKAVGWLSHLGIAILQLAMLSIIGAVIMTILGVVLATLRKGKKAISPDLPPKVEESSAKPL